MESLFDFLACIEAREAALGIVETPERAEALRNKGMERTPERRELLRRCAGRAHAAERDLAPAHC